MVPLCCHWFSIMFVHCVPLGLVQSDFPRPWVGDCPLYRATSHAPLSYDTFFLSLCTCSVCVSYYWISLAPVFFLAMACEQSEGNRSGVIFKFSLCSKYWATFCTTRLLESYLCITGARWSCALKLWCREIELIFLFALCVAQLALRLLSKVIAIS